MEEQICPSCGSNNINTSTADKQLAIPFNPPIPYKTIVNHCAECDETGDFFNENENTLTSILDQGKKSSMDLMIKTLTTNNYSMAYIERAFDLSPRTMMRWKRGEFSDSALALMRTVSIFPFVIDVVDSQFDISYAKKRLLMESAQLLFDFEKIKSTTLETPLGNIDILCGFRPSSTASNKNMEIQQSSSLRTISNNNVNII